MKSGVNFDQHYANAFIQRFINNTSNLSPVNHGSAKTQVRIDSLRNCATYLLATQFKETGRLCAYHRWFFTMLAFGLFYIRHLCFLSSTICGRCAPDPLPPQSYLLFSSTHDIPGLSNHPSSPNSPRLTLQRPENRRCPSYCQVGP